MRRPRPTDVTDRFAFQPLESRTLLAVPGVVLGAYHSDAQLGDDLRDFANYAPSITRLVTIGKTVQNRDILALKVTDNPDAQEAEPEFYYQGLMHGDETVGKEMSIYFVDQLLSGYGSDTRITNLVNSTEIWIVPSINLDGTQLNQRANANGLDLNRSFPDYVADGAFGDRLYGPAATTTGRPPEVQSVMNWTLQQSFTLAANFHTGAVVVNYPYDANGDGIDNYAASPDDGLYRALAVEYAKTNAGMYSHNQSDSTYNSSFTQGITNGDAWYEVYGGQQDWSYRYAGVISTTIELSNTKNPPASKLPTFWNLNKDSMMNYLAAAQWGINGVVKDVSTGLPVAARVRLVGNTQPVFTDADVGDFHRIAQPGTYSVVIDAPGYASRTLTGVNVVGTTPTNLGTIRLSKIESTPPTIAFAGFTYDVAPQQARLKFSEYVGLSLTPSDITVTNLSTGAAIASTAYGLAYDDATNEATLTFATPLADGRYRIALSTGSVNDLAGNALASGFADTFAFRRGDADGSGSVDFDDLLMLAKGFGTTGDARFSQGDFDYDHDVDFDDLLTLAKAFQTPLPSADHSADTLVATSGARAGRRVASDVLA